MKKFTLSLLVALVSLPACRENRSSVSTLTPKAAQDSPSVPTSSAVTNFTGPVSLMVHVDRSIRPEYGDWAKELANPELEHTGPADYDLSKVTLWFHPSQKSGKEVKLQIIYDYLAAHKLLGKALNTQDKEAIMGSTEESDSIRASQAARFRAVFGEKKHAWLWGAVVRDGYGELNVPFLYYASSEGGQVVGCMYVPLKSSANADDPALLFSY